MSLAPSGKGPKHKVSKVLGICLEGWPFVGLGFLITGAIYLLAPMWSILPALVSLWVMWFFRDPDREGDTDPSSILSPADGTILQVVKPFASPWIDSEQVDQYIRVSVFMSVFNVHVNRAPCDGTITGLTYNTGRFLSAFKEKASLENEQMAIWIQPTSGSPLLIVQIAGLIARRIVCKLKKEEPVSKGMRFGLIRFGSRMDVYLPAKEYEILVRSGEKVKAGRTALARRKSGGA